tara:strand:+ start:22478 stop:23419 length:942 start_codon:yes stop_codon:yes gene_type:complete
MDLAEMLSKQSEFAKNFYDADEMSEEEKIEKHKILCLAMQSELSQLANSVHYREHRANITPTHKQNILFETMDVYRYCLAVLNLWGLDAKEAIGAFESRDANLRVRTEKNISKWDGQKVVVVDVDDVIARFRQNFYDWVNKTYPGSNVEYKSSEYFLRKAICGKSGDELLIEFIDAGNLKKLDVCDNVVNGLRKLRKMGYWIHILTARPESELKCLNETYEWLDTFVGEFDSVQLSSEKYIAIAGLEPYKQDKIICAIDDSPKHASEYVMHGVPCLVPERSYNTGVLNNEGVYSFNWEDGDIASLVESISLRS